MLGQDDAAIRATSPNRASKEKDQQRQAQIAANSVTGALNAVSTSASLGYSGSESRSGGFQKSESIHESHQFSSGIHESHNFEHNPTA